MEILAVKNNRKTQSVETNETPFFTLTTAEAAHSNANQISCTFAELILAAFFASYNARQQQRATAKSQFGLLASVTMNTAFARLSKIAYFVHA